MAALTQGMMRNGASSKDKTKGTIFLLTAICSEYN